MGKKFVLALLLAILLGGSVSFTWSLPEIQVPESSIIYDINQRPIKGLAEENRINIGLNEIPETFKMALIAVEDKNFYRHHGVDIVGIVRAILINVKEGKVLAGGSTITQQTAKNLFLTNERTIARKLKELYYALQLEKSYSKDEILTMYCNTIYFGQGAYGVEAAARTYFAKHARDLTLAESALLAGLPRWPSNYDPYLHPDLAKQRQAMVLQRMAEEKLISESTRQTALKQKLNYKKASYLEGEAPYFVALVREYLSKTYGERAVFQGGLQVYTTLDLDMQKAANKAYYEHLEKWQQPYQAALVALDVTNGHIRALIGGRDYNASSYNRVFSRRQPGSTFKPFMYSLAIDSGFTSADRIRCEEVEYRLPNGELYRPTDYGNQPYHWKEFTIKEAVMKSDNVIAVRVNEMLGPVNTARHGEKFGFNGLDPILSLPLGSIEVQPIQMAAAFSVFANQGIYSEPFYILRVVDRNGKVLEENNPQLKQVISSENAYIILNMLEGVLRPGGTGSGLAGIINRPAAAKTGTTDEFRDAWLVGFTPNLCCAVWVGFDNGNSVGLPGGTLAGPIWANFIEQASSKLKKTNFTKPESINLINICLDSGLVATEACPRSIEMAFKAGSEPETICYYHLSGLEWMTDLGENSGAVTGLGH